MTAGFICAEAAGGDGIQGALNAAVVFLYNDCGVYLLCGADPDDELGSLMPYHEEVVGVYTELKVEKGLLAINSEGQVSVKIDVKFASFSCGASGELCSAGVAAKFGLPGVADAGPVASVDSSGVAKVGIEGCARGNCIEGGFFCRSKKIYNEC